MKFEVICSIDPSVREFFEARRNGNAGDGITFLKAFGAVIYDPTAHAPIRMVNVYRCEASFFNYLRSKRTYHCSKAQYKLGWDTKISNNEPWDAVFKTSR